MEEFADVVSPEGRIVEETLRRIKNQSGVKAVVVLNRDNLPIHSTVDGTTTMSLANLCKPIEHMSRSAIRSVDPTDDLVVIRLRTKKNEIIIAPEEENLLVVIQSNEHVE